MGLHTPILVLLHIIKKPSGKKEIASSIGKSEKAVTKAVGSLRKKGLIQYNQTDGVYEPKKNQN